MNLTLFQIEDGLAQLLHHRQERLSDTTDPIGADELKVLDAEISKYQIAEPAKVTGIAAMFRQWKNIRANIKEEIARYRLLDRFVEGMEKRLKDHVAGVLEMLPEPKKGCKQLTGHEGSKLMLKGNGGVEPLQVDGWDSEKEEWITEKTVLPDDFQVATVRMSLALFRKLQQEHEYPTIGLLSQAPNNARIRAALAENCPTCQGFTDYCADVQVCGTCDGTGKRLVPGARLLLRGSHVEVR